MSGLALACPDPEVSTRRRGTKCSDAHHHPEHGSRKSKRRRKLAQDPIFLCSAPEIPGSCMKNEFAIFSPWWVAKKTCRCSHMQVQGLRVEHDARRALASGRPFRPWVQTRGRRAALGWRGAMYDVVSVVAQGTVGLQLGPPSQRRSIKSRAQWPEEVVMPAPCQTRHGLAGDNTA